MTRSAIWTTPCRPSYAQIALVTLTLVYAALVIRTAWLSDDAYISLRMVDNLLAGRGFVWNADERVLAATNPLWMLLLAPIMALTGEEYYATLALSALCSAATLALLIRGAADRWGAALAVGVLALSRAAVDYATSGLENPLSSLLVAAFVARFARGQTGPRALGELVAIASLAAVNRMDAALLFAPAIGVALWREGSGRGLLAAAVGGLPLWIWMSFSLWYYGFLFPNTAYAKLNTDLPADHLAAQGLSYYQWTLARDPLTLVATLTAAAWALRRWREGWPLVLGAAAYLLYVVRIGGDFMGGRFFVAPLVLTLLAATRAPAPRRPAVALGLILALGLPFGLRSAFASYGSGQEYEAQGKGRTKELIWRGIADERLWHSDGHALWSEDRGSARGARREGAPPAVIASGGVGLVGFRAGPDVHVVDLCALGDPLLARLPAVGLRDLRPGHYYRILPTGYLETLEQGAPRFEDPGVAAYYERLSVLTRGPLLSRARLAEILNFNLGVYDGLIDRERYRDPPVERIGVRQLLRAARGGSVQVPAQGLEVALGESWTEPVVEIQVATATDVMVALKRGGRSVARVKVAGLGDGETGPAWRRVEVGDAAERGYDRLVLGPARLDGDQRVRVGRIRRGGGEALDLSGP